MIYEYRDYTIAKGKMADCHRIFQETLIPLLQRVGAKTVAFWEPQDSDGQTFIYLLGFQDAAAREKAWADFANSQEWQKTKAEFGDNAPWLKTQATVLVPTSYSPQP
ncbi:MAG: NIPSNAP family protein, partial [Dehalococcoidia bacterium]